MPSNIYLIGFMGSGKTTVGRELAERLGYVYIDMDDSIESAQKMTISDIFESIGEKYFRGLEKDCLDKVSRYNRHVVSTGGGIVLKKQNITKMRESGRVVLLWAEPETIIDRLKDDTSRPLLQGEDKLQKVLSILETRKPKYLEAADIVINTDGLSIADIITRVTDYLADSKEEAGDAFE